MDRASTLPDLKPIDWSGGDAVTRMRIELGTSREEIAAERLEEARPSLREAMKLLDASETRDLHKLAADLIERTDDLRSVLAERHGD